MLDMPLDFDQLEYEGYTVVHGFMDRARTQRIRDHMDSLLPPIGASREDPKRWHHVLRHPIPGAIMAELLDDPTLLALAARSLKARELRLLEQVLIRSDPRPPPHMPLGWHIDFAFFPRQYQAAPRQTYFHMVHCLNTVAPGGAAFMIVPGSHQLTYAVSAQMETAEELSRLKRDPVGLTGVAVQKGIEICSEEGDLLVFNPMALHSGSSNATDQSRYVYFTSFFDTSASELWQAMRETKYRDGFNREMRADLPEDLRPLLEW